MTDLCLGAVLLLSCTGRRSAPVVAADRTHAPVGMRIRPLDEGLLVESVFPGTGAEAAGLGPGDLVVQVEGVDVKGASKTAAFGLRGPAGSSVDLVVRAPLTGEYREILVERGVGSVVDAPRPALPDSVSRMRTALVRQGPRAARRQTQAALDDDFGGLLPADALGDTLRQAVARRPATALAAAKVLSGAAPGDDALRSKLGEVWFLTQAWQQASVDLAASESGRPADAWDPRGDWRGDAGGNLRGRYMLARSLLALGRPDAATELTRAMLLTSSQPALQELLGVAATRDPKPWQVTLPPLEDLSVQTLDGASWHLSEHRGHPVLLAFFATWCGPCRKELHELVDLWRRHRDQGLDVLAISIDQADTAGDLVPFVDALGLPFPVAHAPALAERFGIDGIPAVRLIDGSGAQIYSARGYSVDGAARTRDAVDQALVAQHDPNSAGRSKLGTAWSVRDSRLIDFQGIEGVRDLALAGDEVVLRRQGAPPIVLHADGQHPDTQGKGPGRGDLLAWQQGPVLSAKGDLWVRAFSREGRPRWILTTVEPVRDLSSSGGLLWISTTQELLAVDALGRLVHRVAGGAQDIASDGQDGLYAVDGSVWRHLDPTGAELARLPAGGAMHVDGTGRVSSGLFSDLLTGRFGPGGALRTVLVRAEDGVLLGLDGDGRAAFTWELGERARIAGTDRDHDGRDELLVVVPRRGLATVALSLP